MAEYIKYKENLSDYPTEMNGLDVLHYKHDLLVEKLEISKLSKASIQEEQNIVADIEKVDKMIEFVESMMNLDVAEEKQVENESEKRKYEDD